MVRYARCFVMPKGGLSGTLLMKIPSNWWPRVRKKEPDPFTESERDRILEFYRPSERTELMLLFFSVSTLVQDLVKGQH